MRFAPVLLVLAIATPALAQAPRPAAEPRPQSPTQDRLDVRSGVIGCPRPLLQHTQEDSATEKRRLVEMPPAYRLHAVDRRVNGCAVYPEAQKVNDGTGALRVRPPLAEDRRELARARRSSPP